MSKKKKGQSQRLDDGTAKDPATESSTNLTAPKKDPATASSMNLTAPKKDPATASSMNLTAPKKDPATASSMNLTAPKDGKIKLSYTDPGVERKLPQPPHISIGPGDRVRLKKTQEYGDATVNAGEEGFALNPSSQAACWCVSFFTAGGGKTRVVPEWLLEPVGARKAGH